MLNIKDLAVKFSTRKGIVDAVRGVNFALDRGEILGVVGESGSGKSVTSYAILRLLEVGGYIHHGEINYAGIDLHSASEKHMRDIRGREISMIFQNPRAALNPTRRVGHQIEDVLIRHLQAKRHNAKEKAVEALKAVRIHDAEKRYYAYPFELSGGMCQRVVIALALACNPRLLIADEPTTGLDITTQKIVMDLVADIIKKRDMSMILITHDLGLASHYCDHVVVMKDGVVVEKGQPLELFMHPKHAYTRKLVFATPRLESTIRGLLPLEQRKKSAHHEIMDDILLQVQDLVKTYQGKGGAIQAIKGISFVLKRGQSLGIVGESGSGKSTTSEIIARLYDPTSGSVHFDGENLLATPASKFMRSPLRRDIQMVFQDAHDSLNPRSAAFDTIAEPLLRIAKLKGQHLQNRVDELADMVGLPRSLLTRFPHQLSGGQKARVGIARAIALEPKLLILDEPTAALDVSIQAIILNLLADLRAEMGMSYLFVSHDLNVVRLLCDEVIVMQHGEIVEHGSIKTVMDNPVHKYTRDLINAVPQPPKIEHVTNERMLACH